jgi:nucleoside-diphosphate-sugar epimerase
MALTLITGASGFLGKAILLELAFQKMQFITVGRQPINHICCDLSLSIPDINGENIDLVIHAAGKAHTYPKSRAEQQSIFDCNVFGTQNLLSGLEKMAQLPKYFVFVSSVAVYGQEAGVGITEQETLKATDPYGLSKVQAEELIASWCKNNNIIFTILRLPLLVGENPPGNLGAMIRGIHKGYYFNIGGGKSKRSMVLIKDVANFIPRIALLGGIYHLTDGEHPSFRELSLAIAKKKILNLPIMLAKILGYLGDFIGSKAPISSIKVKKITNDLTFDDSKARKLGWKSNPVLDYLKNNFQNTTPNFVNKI